MKWSEAEVQCLRQKAHLASIASSAENKWLFEKVRNEKFKSIWLGLLKGGKGISKVYICSKKINISVIISMLKRFVQLDSK